MLCTKSRSEYAFSTRFGISIQDDYRQTFFIARERIRAVMRILPTELWGSGTDVNMVMFVLS